MLTELAVDRTRILRGTGHVDMKPPYEGLYKKGARFGDSVLGVKQFYRKAGLVPDETVSDSADYLCVELDFMKQLCLREEALRLREGEVGETIAKTIATIDWRRSFSGCTWETGSESFAVPWKNMPRPISIEASLSFWMRTFAWTGSGWEASSGSEWRMKPSLLQGYAVLIVKSHYRCAHLILRWHRLGAY